MKYCLFCRESFEDEMQTCPYCGDELLDELPDEDYADDAYAWHGGRAAEKEPEREGPPVVQVAIITSQGDLEAAVDVLKEEEIYFEIEDADRSAAAAGIIPTRAWRLLVDQEEAHDAFVLLVCAIPQAFPRPVADRFAEQSDEGEGARNETAARAAEAIEEIFSRPEGTIDGAVLARHVIEVFSSENPVAITRTKLRLARAGDAAAALLAGIAVEAAAAGGEGAEGVLFHTMQVLEATGYAGALEKVESLYDSPVAQVRTRAAYAAGRLGDPAAVDRLLDLLEDENEDVRYEASESIWRLTGFDFDFEPEAAAEEQQENIRRLREMWREGRKTASVRGRVTLRRLLQGLQGGM